MRRNLILALALALAVGACSSSLDIPPESSGSGTEPAVSTRPARMYDQLPRMASLLSQDLQKVADPDTRILLSAQHVLNRGPDRLDMDRFTRELRGRLQQAAGGRFVILESAPAAHPPDYILEGTVEARDMVDETGVPARYRWVRFYLVTGDKGVLRMNRAFEFRETENGLAPIR